VNCTLLRTIASHVGAAGWALFPAFFSCSVSANLAQPTHNIHAPFLSVARLLWLAGAGASTKRRKKDDAEDEEDVDLSSVVRHSSKADKARNQVRDGC
jgi:hypothetical protein